MTGLQIILMARLIKNQDIKNLTFLKNYGIIIIEKVEKGISYEKGQYVFSQ